MYFVNILSDIWLTLGFKYSMNSTNRLVTFLHISRLIHLILKNVKNPKVHFNRCLITLRI